MTIKHEGDQVWFCHLIHFNSLLKSEIGSVIGSTDHVPGKVVFDFIVFDLFCRGVSIITIFVW